MTLTGYQKMLTLLTQYLPAEASKELQLVTDEFADLNEVPVLMLSILTRIAWQQHQLLVALAAELQTLVQREATGGLRVRILSGPPV